MPQAALEHINVTVSDIDRSARLFESLCGWQRRWRGPARNGGETLHLGTEHAYLALHSTSLDHPELADSHPLNHVGIAVDDLAAAERVVQEHGLTPFNHQDYHPGRRFYFLDWDGIEFELVSYADAGSQNARS